VPDPVPEITVAELASRLPEALLVDVRQPAEYVEAHVPTARLVPLQELPDRVGELPAGEPVFVICRSGARSLVASEFLVAQGFEAVNVAGGTLAWIEAGKDVVVGDQPA
jgi:rhodanese-related sulfurtransferase